MASPSNRNSVSSDLTTASSSSQPSTDTPPGNNPRNSYRSSLSSSSNGRLTPVSSRLSVRVPDNSPFLPTRVAAGGGAAASQGADSRPGSSLSRSWDAAEDGEGADEAEWADEDDEDAERERRIRREDDRGTSLDDTDGLAIALDGVGSSDGGASGVDQQGGDSEPYSSLQAGDGFGLGLGLGVGGSSFLPGGLLSTSPAVAEPAARRWSPSAAGLPFPPTISRQSSDNHARERSYSSPSSSANPSSITSHPSEASTQSLHPSVLSTAASSNSSTLSLPSVPPVDLSLPNVRPGGTYVSVADSRMASLAANNNPSSSRSSTGARAFFSNLLNRSPRAGNMSPRFTSPSPSPATSPNPDGPPRSPSAPLGWQYQHPSVASLQSSDNVHTRSTSLPTLAGGVPAPRDSSDLYRPAPAPGGSPNPEGPQRRTPRALAAATFAGLTRSASLTTNRSGSPRLGSAPLAGSPSSTSRSSRAPPPRPQTNSPVPTIGFATPPLPSSSAPEPAPPTLASMGLTHVPLTQPLSLSRNGQPLCGALLDNRYLLIGTSIGLDFLPLPLPGSLPMMQHGKKRKETRKPIPLIKRTRFKELAVLSERSNILLAIAGRNDHIRVYALDGIRAMIEKKMAELDIRDGYPIIQDASIFDPKRSADVKGKGRAAPPPPDSLDPSSSSRPISTFPPSLRADASPSYQFPPSTAPPDYTAPAPSPRRRPPSWHTSRPPSWHQGGAVPPSPARSTHRNVPASAPFVRAVPTNPANPAPRGSVSSQTTVTPGTPRTIRGQKSREFSAGRKGSSATIRNRRSRADLHTPPLPGSRRSSLASQGGRRGSSQGSPRAEEDEQDRERFEPHLPVPSPLSASRRPSAMSDSGWMTESSPVPRSGSRMEPRAPVKPQNPLERSPTSDLADFLRESGPEMHSPEMDTVLSSSRQRRRSSITDNLLQASKDAHLFPAKNSPTRPGFVRSVTASHVAGLQLYTAGTSDGEKDELVEMLQESAAEVASDHRRASVNDFRRHEPRPATSPPLKQQERSPALELAELLRETGPEEPLRVSPDPALAAARSARPSPRQPTTPRLGAGQKSPSMELAELLRQTGPKDDSPGSSSSLEQETFSTPLQDPEATFDDPFVTSRPHAPAASANNGKAPQNGSRLVARSPVAGAESTDETDGGAASDGRKRRPTLAEVIREGPLPSTSAGLGISAGASSPGSRASKRWTMSGFLGRPRSDSQTDSLSASPLPNRPASSASNYQNPPPRRSEDSRGSSSPWEMVPEPSRAPEERQPAPRSSRRAEEYKRRPASSLHRSEPPVLPTSNQVPPDAHPANSASPLEYVKLARTKGARLLRAVETKKRTYLAVLCGEEGERIELFTGSRSISLSLNRTFVLPESPRTISFQLQGDDLVDLYLVYAESIFALEPATVRVREVGVGRGERRARRERERRMRTLAATSRTPPPEEGGTADEVRSPNLHSALHPADPALQEGQQDAGDRSDDLGVPPAGRSRTPSPSSASRPQAASPTGAHDAPPAFPADEFPAQRREPSPPPRPTEGDQPTTSSRSSKQVIPYSTFQQLPFVPPVPSAVLSSAWTIPPLYTDVVAGSPVPPSPHFDDQPQPSITVTGDNGFLADPTAGTAPMRPAANGADLPLLSPISLLGGAALRQNGPPGLFFVSKGKSLSGIVTADGKSIIKRPLVWSQDKVDNSSEQGSDVPQHVEILVVGGTRTVVCKIGSQDVKAISVDGGSPSSPFSPALTVTSTRTRPSIQFLATHSPSQQLFFAQTVGSSFTVHCLELRIMSPVALADLNSVSQPVLEGFVAPIETKSVYKIASIPADGIGPEVIEAGIAVLNAIAKKSGTFSFDFEHFDWSSETYKRTGSYLPPNHLDILRKFDAILFGAVGAPDVPDHISLWGLRLAICQPLQQYANVRRTRVLRGTSSPLANCPPGKLDWVIVRENSEGEYAGQGGRSHQGFDHEVATEVSIFTRTAVRRIARFAFELAQSRPRRKLTYVTKSNAQRNGMVMWDEVMNEVAKDFPNVELDHMLVDAMTCRMVLHPESLDTI
ncbi:hypothetical protein JCM10207_004928, partial [Rhodosporidiobolus poonsookiae]